MKYFTKCKEHIPGAYAPDAAGRAARKRRTHMNKRLENQIAIVVGGTSGIGEGIAKTYAENGATVIVAGPAFDEEAGKQVADEINKSGGKAEYRMADVTDEASIKKLMDGVAADYGRIDILNNNAGVPTPPCGLADFADQSAADWDAIMNLNARGCFFGMKYALPYMVKQKGGAIINTASSAGFKVSAVPGQISLYGVSKGAVATLTRTAAAEYAQFGVRINSMSPGYIGTKKLQFQNFPPEEYKKVLDGIPMGRVGTPEDVALVSLFLASRDAQYVTGQNIFVDGGHMVV